MQIILNYIKENKKKLLIVVILIIILTIISLYLNNRKENKIYYSENYVYTKESYNHTDNLVSELPYINIVGEEISKINVKLIELYYEIITLDEKIMVYNYYISDDILSLIVKIYYKEAPDSYPSEIYFYNIDIDDKIILTNNDLLKKFNVSIDDVSDIVRDGIKEYYDYEIRNGYISNECNFDCYLSETDSLPILNDINYYVNDDYLFAYKSISLDSKFFYDINSGFYLFNFRIK